MDGENNVLRCCYDNHGNFDNQGFSQLAAKLHGMITACIRKYYLPGGDFDDLYQWGLIGLYKAVVHYNENDRYSFDFIASQNIQNTVKTAVTSANRQKHRCANEAESLHSKRLNRNGDSYELIDTLVTNHQQADPSTLLIDKESTEKLHHFINDYLSEYERRSILLYIGGYRLQDIAEELNIHRKVADNSIQRAKKKISRYVMSQAKESAC